MRFQTQRRNVHVGVEHDQLDPVLPRQDDIEAEINAAFLKAEAAPWP